MVDIYYCKTPDDFRYIIESEELQQGTNLDNDDSVFTDLNVYNAKARTAQAELEQLLANRFNIKVLRLINSEYLRYAHAIIIWWHLQINSEIREIIQKKYDDLIKNLAAVNYIISDDGGKIEAEVRPGETAGIRKGAQVAHRTLNVAVRAYRGFYPIYPAVAPLQLRTIPQRYPLNGYQDSETILDPDPFIEIIP